MQKRKDQMFAAQNVWEMEDYSRKYAMIEKLLGAMFPVSKIFMWILNYPITLALSVGVEQLTWGDSKKQFWSKRKAAQRQAPYGWY